MLAVTVTCTLYNHMYTHSLSANKQLIPKRAPNLRQSSRLCHYTKT